MNKKIFISTVLLATAITAMAEHVDVKWTLNNYQEPGTAVQTEGTAELLTNAFNIGSNMEVSGELLNSNAASGFTAVTYETPFTKFVSAKRVTTKTSGYSISFMVNTASGHTFKPTSIELDAVKIGTDGGNFDVYIQSGSNSEKAIETTISPLRNQVREGNPNAYSHHVYTLSNEIIGGRQAFRIILYIYNFNGKNDENPKEIGFRNVTLSGEIDEPIYDASHYFSAASCSAGDLMSVVGSLKNGEVGKWAEKLYGDPTDFKITAAEGYTATIAYNNKVATLKAQKDNKDVFSASVRFVVSHRQPKPEAKPLDRGLLAVKTGSGVLVSWRFRESDDADNTKFRLYRNGVRIGQNPITLKTNYLDTGGTATSTYTLEVLNKDGQVVEKQENVKAWATPCLTIPTQTPLDTRNLGATYTPNDACVCDMDGDGQYEIILKWDPSNSKDAASSGVTSSTYIDCYKLNGTRLWRIDIGPNIRSGAHTTPYLAYDFDGDGYGELICKTAPGTVDGEGNYVVMGNDDPTANWLNGRGKPDAGPEYLTVFDGITGGEITTVEYHTKYGDVSASGFWGDNEQNRSERYLACMAYLDGKHPSAIFCRGYYRGASVGAYDFDGDELRLRWLHRSATSGKELWNEGAHSVTTGDFDGDGKDEITYGSAALDDNGKVLYRTGLGHGDALHTGDFDPNRPGMETFMVHEEKHGNNAYGHDLRDAATGEILIHVNGKSDTGRGLIADFDDDNEGYEFGTSDTYNLYNIKGEVIGQWNNGTTSSSTMNYRIYWDGDLYDEYHDRLHIDKWNSASKSFGRVNTLYNTYSGCSTINSTKNNPNLQADFLGDWREEIIYYNVNNNSLMLMTTDLQSDYRVPFLMDDRQYCEAIVWQNVGYNQPPHVSYNPISRFTIEKTVPQDGWDVFYSPYPVTIPEGIQAYAVSGIVADVDTTRLSKLRNGATIPADKGILYKGTAGQKLKFVPSIKTVSSVTATYLKGSCVDSLLTNNPDAYEYFYELRRDAESGDMGFFRIDDSKLQPANTPWLRVKGTAANIPAACYWLSKHESGKEPQPDGIREIDEKDMRHAVLFDLQGRRVRPEDVQKGRIYIQDGQKIVK